MQTILTAFSVMQRFSGGFTFLYL